jgi:hypothetical protein
MVGLDLTGLTQSYRFFVMFTTSSSGRLSGDPAK